MSITYKLNKDKNGVEIKFTEKPSEKVRARLKELGFRWSQFQGVWYAKQTPETIAYAKELASEEGEQIAFSMPEPPEDIPEYAITKKAEKKPEKKAEPKKEVKKAITKTEPKKAEKKEAAKPSSASANTETPKKDNIVVFPKSRPEVKVAITEGNATYEDCKTKLETERKIFCDSDSQFVIDGLLKMCEINPNFRNNIMRPDKSYEGAFKYFMDMARKGYALQYNGVTYLDNNIALGFAMDYFNEANVPSNVVTGEISKAN